MGLFDRRPSTTTTPPPPSTTSPGKENVVGWLSRQLEETQQKLSELQETHRAAECARDIAVTRVKKLTSEVQELRETVDNGRAQKWVFDTLEQEAQNLRTESVALRMENTRLRAKEQELLALRREQVDNPLSDADLLKRFTDLSTAFDSLASTLECPVCYEPLTKASVSTATCGHSFCEPCARDWEQQQTERFRLSAHQGTYGGAECPLCREPDPRRGKIRIHALEEILLVVDHAKKQLEQNPYTPPLRPPVTVEAQERLDDEGATARIPVTKTTMTDERGVAEESIDVYREAAAATGRWDDDVVTTTDPPSSTFTARPPSPSVVWDTAPRAASSSSTSTSTSIPPLSPSPPSATENPYFSLSPSLTAVLPSLPPTSPPSPTPPHASAIRDTSAAAVDQDAAEDERAESRARERREREQEEEELSWLRRFDRPRRAY